METTCLSLGKAARALATGAAGRAIVTHSRHQKRVECGEGRGESKAGEGEELAVDDRAAKREAEPLVVVLRAHSELVNVAWRPQRGGKD